MYYTIWWKNKSRRTRFLDKQMVERIQQKMEIQQFVTRNIKNRYKTENFKREKQEKTAKEISSKHFPLPFGQNFIKFVFFQKLFFIKEFDKTAKF